MQNGINHGDDAPIVVARCQPVGMRVHVLFGIGHYAAVTGRLKHLNIVVGIAERAGIRDIHA